MPVSCLALRKPIPNVLPQGSGRTALASKEPEAGTTPWVPILLSFTALVTLDE